VALGIITAELVAAIQNHFPEVELDLFPPKQTGALVKAAMQWIKPAPISIGCGDQQIGLLEAKAEGQYQGWW